MQFTQSLVIWQIHCRTILQTFTEYVKTPPELFVRVNKISLELCVKVCKFVECTDFVILYAKIVSMLCVNWNGNIHNENSCMFRM